MSLRSQVTISFFIPITFLKVISLGQSEQNSLPYVSIPTQELPVELKSAEELTPLPNLGQSTNLVSLLKQIRTLSSNGDFEKAQALTQSALGSIEISDQNRFYLSQIRQEETKLYYSLATKAMQEKKFSLASQLLDRYRENIALELSERKRKREVVLQKDGPKDVSLVGKLVKELEQAKKDLAEIRAKSGLPEDDAKPDLQRLMEQEQAKVSSTMRQGERLLLKARKSGEDGRYEEALELLNEALKIMPEGYNTIAMISDLYKAKQQITWYRMGEAMLKGKVSEVQELVLEYKMIEESRRESVIRTWLVPDELELCACARVLVFPVSVFPNP